MLATADTLIRALHLIGAAVWVGGMVFLGLAVAVARGAVDDAERIALFRGLGRRFAIFGGLALVVLIATGTEMASDRLPSWSALTDSDYGRRLLEKLSLVGLVIALTAIHTFVQGPALSRLRAQALERPDDRDLAALIRRKSVRAGIVSGLNLVASIAILYMAARLVTG